VLAAALLALAACGGDGATEPRGVVGNGFSASVPGDWDVTVSVRRLRATPSEEAVERIEVATFRLARRYRPSLWPEVVTELDGVAAQLAQRLGRDAARSPGRTEVIASRRSRVYDIAYSRDGEGRVERVAFVLAGRREFQLLCRWNSGDPGEGEEACALLFSSFTLA
jgi:plasmid stabilization system protein ParE